MTECIMSLGEQIMTNNRVIEESEERNLFGEEEEKLNGIQIKIEGRTCIEQEWEIQKC